MNTPAGTFWLTAALGDATVKALVQSDLVDEMVSNFDQAVKGIPPEADVRSLTRQTVVNALLENSHTDEEVGAEVAQALLWLLVKGQSGEKILPVLRRGGAAMQVHQEITRIDADHFNFRTIVDAETGAQISL